MKALESHLVRGADALGVTLSGLHLDSLATFAAELCKWNRKINLTSIVLPEEIAIKHFIDSLALVKYVDLAGKLLDIGSGGGFPSIPVKIILPDIDIVSVDAVEKKILFQRHVARLLNFERFSALHCRVENLPEQYKGAFNCIVSRAFSEITVFVKYALPLLADDGVIVAMKGKDGKKEAEESAEEMERIGGVISSIHEFQLPLLNDARSLIIIRKK